MAQKSFVLKSKYGVFSGVWIFLLAGCSSHLTQPDGGIAFENQPVVVEGDSPLGLSKAVKGSHSTVLTGQVMYQIMVAELLVQNKRPVEAYKMLQPLAEQTQDPKLAQRAFELSMSTLNIKDITQSVNLLMKVAPNDPVGWKAAYILSAAQGHTQQAVKQWRRYVKLSQVPLAQQFIATAKKIAKTCKKQPGLAFLSALKIQYPDQKSAVYAYAVAAYFYGDFDQAQTNLWKAEALYADRKSSVLYQDIHNYLAGTYLSLKQPKQGLQGLKSYLDAHPKEWEFQQNYARLELAAGLYSQAEQRFSFIAKNNPNNQEVHFALALILLEQGKMAQAEKRLQTLVKDPEYQDSAHYYLGVLYQKQKNIKMALHEYALVSAGSFWVDAQIHQAQLQYPKQGVAKTIKFLDKALVSKQASGLARIKLWRAEAIFYQDVKDYRQAIGAYHKILVINPNSIESLFAQSILFYDQKDYQSYIGNLKKILAINPKQADALNALGYYYLDEQHDLAKAEDLINQALAVSPDAYYILDSKGWLLYQQQDYVTAEQVLKKAFDQQVDDEVLIHLLKTQWRLKKYQTAEALWQKYHTRFPKNKELNKLLNQLKLKK